jgi:hypothetical protein
MFISFNAGQGVLDRQGYIPQLCIPHIIPAYHQKATNDKLASFMFIVRFTTSPSTFGVDGVAKFD